MNKIIPLMRDKMMACGVHTYGVSGNQLQNKLFYSGYGSSIFTVEFFFDAILLMHFDNSEIAANTLGIYLSFQQDDGFLCRHIEPLGGAGPNPFTMYEAEEHAQPYLFRIALLIARKRGGDLSWLSRGDYERLKKYLDHWLRYWVRDDSGLCVWSGAQHGCSDTAFERAGSWRSLYCAGSDLNGALYAEFRAAALIAAALRFPDDAERYRRLADQRRDMVQRYLWNERDGIFYDMDVRTGEPIRVKHCHCFDALDAQLATPEQAERMVKEHIVNPNEFWTPYPIPSYALTEPGYTQHHRMPEGADFTYALGDGHCNWRGGLWPHTAYRLAHGLCLYGYRDEALHIARQMQALVRANPLLHEWYNAETGEGCGSTPFYAGVEILSCFLEAEIQAGFSPFALHGADVPLGNEPVMRALDVRPIPEHI